MIKISYQVKRALIIWRNEKNINKSAARSAEHQFSHMWDRKSLNVIADEHKLQIPSRRSDDKAAMESIRARYITIEKNPPICGICVAFESRGTFSLRRYKSPGGFIKAIIKRPRMIERLELYLALQFCARPQSLWEWNVCLWPVGVNHKVLFNVDN